MTADSNDCDTNILVLMTGFVKPFR